ncbi:MAG: HAD-IA family hydrolase [Candidatus Bathyarchaeota archaeon]|nr:HAD-IA family hydrolase [Candidatus Bathyarchaeota archaeon]MDI6805944.1 HAD-IA family hydrolase [Candidatus Bathyarchaeia archaeon]
MIEAVIFDLDGTLIHLPIDYDKLFQEINQITKTSNLHPLTEVVAKLDEETKKKVFEVWNKIEIEALTKMKVNNEGIAHYKKFLEKKKALVTMQGKPFVQAALNRLGLSFNFVITREDSLNRVEQLKIAAKKLEIQTRNILFIGNTNGDMRAAETVGCQFMRV